MKCELQDGLTDILKNHIGFSHLIKQIKKIYEMDKYFRIIIQTCNK